VKAVAYLHEKEISHRDLKLENVVLNAELEPFLVDFGFAVDDSEFGIPKQNLVCGTPSYMAPELFDNKEVDFYKADVWALGVVLFMMLSGGQFPF
jgi:serine/threonine protein kinase